MSALLADHMDEDTTQGPPDAPTLRPYQTDVIDRVRDEIRRGHKRILLVAPTGSGKTVIAGSIIRGAADKGNSVLFLAHRRELIAQAHDKL